MKRIHLHSLIIDERQKYYGFSLISFMIAFIVTYSIAQSTLILNKRGYRAKHATCFLSTRNMNRCLCCCLCEQLKSFSLFSLPSPKVQIANMTRGQISAREKGANNCSSEPLRPQLVCSGQVFTWTRTSNHPTPEWIISAIITRPELSVPPLTVPSE